AAAHRRAASPDPFLRGRLVLPAQAARLEVEGEELSRARAYVDGAVRDRGRALDRLAHLVRPEDGERRGERVRYGAGEGGIPAEVRPVRRVAGRRGGGEREDRGGEASAQDPASRTRSNVAAS